MAPGLVEEGSSARPSISVVVPFHGDDSATSQLGAALGAVDTLPGDEILVVDNSGTGAAGRLGGGQVRVVNASEQRSSYYARNVGAEHASNEWLLFLDADCHPLPGLLHAFFNPHPDSHCGAVGGAVLPARGQPGAIARYQRSRAWLSQADFAAHPYRPVAITANVLVRRVAWTSLGGFQERIRSGGDWDFSWRLQEAGWRLEYREAAAVEHWHRERLGPLLRQCARSAAGRAWVNRRHPGSPRNLAPGRRIARAGAGTLAWALSGRLGQARFKALDGLVALADTVGYALPNGAASAATAPGSRKGIVLFADSFPELTENFVPGEARALGRVGHPVRIEAGARPARPNRAAGRGLAATYLEDDGIGARLAASAWLGVRHPAACARDLMARRRWRREEPVWPLRTLAPAAWRLSRERTGHLHAHFAGSACLNAMRLADVLGLPFSVMPHAYDVFQRPTNLVEKLERAAFAGNECEYTTSFLRTLVAPHHRDRIHQIVMGVDGSSFRRQRPYPGRRSVIAVGRLVEKKGFDHLIEAALLLERGGCLDRLTVVGDGPLRGRLAERVEEAGLQQTVELKGALDHTKVRQAMEAADLLAMPCVVAADGDRDSLPVVVLEALAMEIPVVASDAVGLPEVVRPEWGRLVPPADPEALAAAIGEVLALSGERRGAMGAEARAWVLRAHDADTAATKISRLVEGNRALENEHPVADRGPKAAHQLD